MGEDSIGLNADGAGKKVRTNSRVVGADTVHEEVFIVTDGAGNIIDPRKNVETTGTVTGTVTANAGTNLNTSALALETTLGTVHGHVDSIDGKITACNTGAVAGTLTQSTKHDAATYKTALFYASADGDIVAAVANKKIKVHYLDIQAQGTVTVAIKDDNAGGTRLDEWKLTDREGAVKAFVPYPASHYVTLQTAGKALYCDVSAAVTVKINVIYTDADAS